MMSESVENFDLEDKTLSLIDVCFEDDCLYNSPSRDSQFPHFSDNQTEHKTVHLLGVRTPEEESIEGDERIIQPLESADKEKTRTNEKYNLRKSLAWDSAFFTSAGVLEPEELSTMISGTEKGGKNNVLPGIEEDIRRSTDSISSFTTDNSTLATLEDDLFGDIRASIQKSSKASKATISYGEVGSRINESQHNKSSMKANVVSQNKLTTKSATDKTNVVSKGSQEQANQVSPQASKAGCKNGESTSFCKPPKIVGRVSPMLTSANKRASLGVNRVKMEKDSAKPSTGHSDNPKKFTVAGRGTKLPTMGGSRNTLPKSTLPSKSSLQSSVASKTELTTPSSSVDSLESLSSESSTTRSLNSVKRKTDSRTGNHSSTVSTVKSTLRTASRSKNQSVTSHISPYLKSVTKLSSSVSPSSSISEWSLESVSPTSTLNKRTNSSRPTLDIASCEDALDNGDAPRVFDSKNHSGERSSVGHDTHVIGLPSESGKRASIGAGALGHLDSIKPSRLRMPSPKIGFFDGARSTVRSPGGSMQSHPAVPNGLPRYRVRNVSLSGGSNAAKLGKSQPARAALAVRAAKTCAQQPVCSTSTNGKYYPGMPLKVQNKMSPGNSGQRNLKVEKITAEDCDTATNNAYIGNADGNDSRRKNKLSPPSESNGPENTILSQKVGEKEILGSLSNTSEKGLDLAQQVEAINIHREIQQKPVLDCSLHQVSASGKVNVGSTVQKQVSCRYLEEE